MSDDKHLRTFIALELPESLRTHLAELQRALKRSGVGARFVKPDSIHLTLKFLGPTEPDKVEAIRKALVDATSTAAPLRLTASGIGSFPERGKPKVLWVGLEGDAEACVELAGAVDRVATTLGFGAETRPFRPHLTLARFKMPTSNARLKRAIGNLADKSFGKFTAKELIHFRSELNPSGARYTPLWRLPLGG